MSQFTHLLRQYCGEKSCYKAILDFMQLCRYNLRQIFIYKCSSCSRTIRMFIVTPSPVILVACIYHSHKIDHIITVVGALLQFIAGVHYKSSEVDFRGKVLCFCAIFHTLQEVQWSPICKHFTN